MSDIAPEISIENWLTDVRDYVSKTDPALLTLLDTYSEEARFGRQYIAEDLSRLPKGATVLEVGAGALLLSCQLRKEGFFITALEPGGADFSSSHKLRAAVLDFARKLDITPEIISVPVEHFQRENAFDFAFSINVMEHVESVSLSLKNITRAVKVGGQYRFTCPNYLFPYEPHFGIPTLFSKRLTECALRRFILRNTRVDAPAEIWRSLNWITADEVVRTVHDLPEITVRFNRNFFGNTLARVTRDKEFAGRRSWCVRQLAAFMVRTGLHRIMDCLPPSIQPVMDCVLEKHGLCGS